MNTITAPDELTRKSNTTWGASVAAMIPKNPASAPISTEPTGTLRAFSLTSDLRCVAAFGEHEHHA